VSRCSQDGSSSDCDAQEGFLHVQLLGDGGGLGVAAHKAI
jgi:hypothetical protein